jgi:hypothetical protein
VNLKDIENFLLTYLDPTQGDGKFHAWRQKAKHFIRLWLRTYIRTDMRLSYLLIFGMMVIGVLVNLFMPHGWTVWPFVMAAGMMLLIHEAADRNGEGIPPLYVYAFFIGAMLSWFLMMTMLSLINPVILIVGLIVMGYYSALGYIRQREHKRLVMRRRMDGQCIYCGTPADYDLAFCAKCGREPDPDDAQLKRVAHAPRGDGIKQRARDSLKPPPAATAMKSKEQALIDRRREPRMKKRM